MSNHLFSQFDTKQGAQPQGASAQVFTITPSTSNAVDGHAARTTGSATMATLFVAPPQRSQATTLSSLLDIRHGRSFQMIKIGS